MNRTAARQMLDTHEAAITANVADYFAGRITHAEFSERQRADHDAIAEAGQTDHFLRRWRRGTPAPAGA